MKRSIRILLSLMTMVLALSMVGFGAYAAGILSQTTSIQTNIAYDPNAAGISVATSVQAITNIGGEISEPLDMGMTQGVSAGDRIFALDGVVNFSSMGDSVTYRISAANMGGLPVDITTDFGSYPSSYVVEIKCNDAYIARDTLTRLDVGEVAEYEISIRLQTVSAASAYTQPIQMKIVKSAT